MVGGPSGPVRFPSGGLDANRRPGVLPLLFATGPGANARYAVGVATFLGMLTACVVGMLFVPPLSVFFRRLPSNSATCQNAPDFGTILAWRLMMTSTVSQQRITGS